MILGGVNLRTAMRMIDWVADTKLKQAAEYYMFDFENGVTPEDIDAIPCAYTGSGNVLRC